MGKNSGGTRSGNSGNPTGNRTVRSTELQNRLMEARDRVVSLEYERDNLIMAGADQDEINQLTAQIADMREVVRRLERNEPQTSDNSTGEIRIDELPNIIRSQQTGFYEKAKKEFAQGQYGRGGADSPNGSRLYDLTEVIRDANRTESQYIQMALRGDKEAQRKVAKARARRRAASEEMNKRLK